MKEDIRKIYLKKKNKKVKIVKLKDILFKPFFGCFDENVEEVIFENFDFEDIKLLILTAKNGETKIIFRNCELEDLSIQGGKTYLRRVTARNISINNSERVSLKENNNITKKLTIKSKKSYYRR